jgi:heat-inducible transcriptional repressor
MTTERQLDLLAKIIEYYIKTGDPVSSAVIKEHFNIEYSSSKIRYEMASLEDDGYLEKTYKSAGRVPTTKAYEYYVINVTPSQKYRREIKKEFDLILNDREKNIDEVLSASIDIINNSTNTFGLINKKIENTRLEDIRLYPTDSKEGLIIMVLSDGTVNQSTLSINDLNFEDLSIAINLFANRLIGIKIKDIMPRALELKEILTESIFILENQYQSFLSQLFDSVLEQTMSMSGVNSLLDISNQQDIENMKIILDKVKDRSIFDLLKQSETIETNNAKIYLEFDSPELKEIAVVEKTINVGNSKRIITLLGKKNQNYQEIFDGLDVLETELEKYKE